jgi:hypothetical protein
MSKHLSSAKSAKDKMTLVDLDDLALAMHADATFMSDKDYEAAQARLAKRKQIMAPRKPIHLSRYGLFIAGLTAGALLSLLVAFVMRTTGTLSGIMLAIGTALVLGVIGANIEGVDE